MTQLIVPTSAAADVSSYVQRTTLDGVEYVLRFDWNDREGRWYMTLADRDGEPIANGVKVVCGWPLLRRSADARAPAGMLMAVDQSGQGLDPGLSELGGRVPLVYFDAAELAALRDLPAAERSILIGGGPIGEGDMGGL